MRETRGALPRASIRRAYEAGRSVDVHGPLVLRPRRVLAKRPAAARGRHRRVDGHEVRGRLTVLDPGVERGEPIPARLERTVAVTEARHDVETHEVLELVGTEAC